MPEEGDEIWSSISVRISPEAPPTANGKRMQAGHRPPKPHGTHESCGSLKEPSEAFRDHNMATTETKSNKDCCS